MSNQIDPTVDPYGYIGRARNVDGSITRIFDFFAKTPACSNNDSIPVLTKDIPVNESGSIWIRVFVPRKVLDSPTKAKLPLIVYYHGGGFVLGSAAGSICYEFCTNVAVEIPAVIVSPEYRLAPEHRLPAAYDDSMEALEWIKNTSDEWLTNYADFSKCYLMGSSAGGNIAYHIGLRSVTCVDHLSPLKIQGLILHQPFFGGTQRTQSELRLANDKIFPPCVADVMWELALPMEFDRDHEYCNPTVGIKSEMLAKIKGQGWKILVTGCEGDPLIDRQIQLVKVLKEKGLRVAGEFSDGGCHGFEFHDASKAKILFGVLKNFLTIS